MGLFGTLVEFVSGGAFNRAVCTPVMNCSLVTNNWSLYIHNFLS
jgi:hypothetical protein